MINVIFNVANENVSLDYNKSRAFINWKFKYPMNVKSIVVSKGKIK